MNESRVGEQLENLQSWWEVYGKRVLTVAVTALALGLGWNQWGSWQERQERKASDLYQLLWNVVLNNEDSEALPLDEAGETVIQLAASLRTNHASSIYAQYGSLLEAKQAVQEGDLQRAEDALQWILAHEPDDVIGPITYYRLARLAWARGDRQSAQRYVLTPEAGYFLPVFQELRGDMLWDFDIPEQAQQAYRLAAQNYGDNPPENLRIKMQQIDSIVAAASEKTVDAADTQPSAAAGEQAADAADTQPSAAAGEQAADAADTQPSAAAGEQAADAADTQPSAAAGEQAAGAADAQPSAAAGEEAGQ